MGIRFHTHLKTEKGYTITLKSTEDLDEIALIGLRGKDLKLVPAQDGLFDGPDEIQTEIRDSLKRLEGRIAHFDAKKVAATEAKLLEGQLQATSVSEKEHPALPGVTTDHTTETEGGF